VGLDDVPDSWKLDQAERQLPQILIFVALDECLEMGGDFRHLHVAAPAGFII
jgi:hypothetical protein